MKAPDEGDILALLLSDASTLKLPEAQAEVEEIVESKQSIIPDGLLNAFSLLEIVGLLPFLESGKAALPETKRQRK